MHLSRRGDGSGMCERARVDSRERKPMAVILLIDDNADSQVIYSKVLEHRGHACHVAGNGAVGVERARALVPDLVLMDLTMPVMNGWEALALLRRDVATSAIPVVALTARARAEDEAPKHGVRFDLYITKPIDPIQVVNLLEELLGARLGSAGSDRGAAPVGAFEGGDR